MRIKKSMILGTSTLGLLSTGITAVQAEDWAQGANNNKSVDIDGGDGVLTGRLDGMNKHIFYRDTAHNKVVRQYFTDSEFPGSTSQLWMTINGNRIDLKNATVSKYYTKTDGTKAELTEGEAVISQDLTTGPNGGILVTYSVKNTSNSAMSVMVRENIDTQLNGDDRVPIKSLGDGKGVYILNAPYRLDYRMDVPNGPDQFAGRNYTERDFTDGEHARVTQPVDTDLYTGDTGIHMQWNTVSIPPGETRSFSYEVKLAGTSTISGTLTRDASPDDTPDTTGKLFPQTPLNLTIQSELEGVNYKSANKVIEFTLPDGMSYEGDNITVTWPDGSSETLPVTKSGKVVKVDVSNASKWTGTSGTVKAVGHVTADSSLENRDVAINVALTSKGSTRGVVKGHISEIPARKVTVKYLDENGQELDNSVVEQIRKNQSYDMNPKKKTSITHDGTEYEYFATEGSATGTVGNDHITVAFKYRPKPAKDVVVTFKTRDGRTLQDDQHLTGRQKEQVFPQGKDVYLASVKKIEERNGDLWELIPPTSAPERFTTSDQRFELTYYRSRTSRHEPIPYATEIIEDETLPEGEERVTVEGWTGAREIVTHFDQNGHQIGEDRRIVEHMRTKIVHKGVKGATTAIEKQPIAYTSRTVEDPTMMVGERKVVQEGKFGEKSITRTWNTWRKYKIGDPTNVVEEITKQPVEEIVHVGTRENILELDYDILRRKRLNNQKVAEGTDGGRAHLKSYAVAKGEVVSEITDKPHLLRMPIDDMISKPIVIESKSINAVGKSSLSIRKQAPDKVTTPESIDKTNNDTISAIRKLYSSLKNLSVRRLT